MSPPGQIALNGAAIAKEIAHVLETGRPYGAHGPKGFSPIDRFERLAYEASGFAEGHDSDSLMLLFLQDFDEPHSNISPGLPGDPARRRWPRTKHLAQQDRLSQVIAVMQRDGLEHFQLACLSALQQKIRPSRLTAHLRQFIPEASHSLFPLLRIPRFCVAGPASRRMGMRRLARVDRQQAV
jgi:hypothetical protein